MVLRARIPLALLALVLPAAPRAHGVTGEVERRGAAFAVRVSYAGGSPLARAWYEVVRPGEPARVERRGRTDAEGWVEFVPDAPGRWQVRIVDASGHGRVVTVDVGEIAAASPPLRPAAGR
jgi:nickel transport protein